MRITASIKPSPLGEQPTARSRLKRKEKTARERGFFLDLKTLAAALTSMPHSLDSLAEFLEVPRKTSFQDFGREIDGEFIRYAVNVLPGPYAPIFGAWAQKDAGPSDLFGSQSWQSLSAGDGHQAVEEGSAGF